MSQDSQSQTAARCLVLIPVYNAEPYLEELTARLRAHLPDSNLLFVNDGSTDSSAAVLARLGVPILTHRLNQGKGAALKTGFRYAIEHGYTSVVTIDADLQHLPEDIPLFAALDDNRHLIIGTRAIDLRKMPFLRWLTNNLTSLIISLFSGSRVRDSQSGYRLIPTTVLADLPLRTIRYDLESEMLFKAGALGCRFAEVPIATIYHGSKSFINPFVDSGRFIRQLWKRIWY